MGAIISNQTLSPFQGWGFYWAIFPGRCPGLSHFAPSGQLQAYRKDFPVPEPVEGALSKPHIHTVAHASGSERSVLIPCNSVANAYSFVFQYQRIYIRRSIGIKTTVAHASGSESSVLFPWQILLLPLVLPSVFFRVIPWLIFCLCLFFLPWLLFFFLPT